MMSEKYRKLTAALKELLLDYGELKVKEIKELLHINGNEYNILIGCATNQFTLYEEKGVCGIL